MNKKNDVFNFLSEEELINLNGGSRFSWLRFLTGKPFWAGSAFVAEALAHKGNPSNTKYPTTWNH